MVRQQETRPVLDIPRTRVDQVVNAAGAVLLAILFIVPAMAWTRLPDQVPMHFGFSGTVTTWSGRWMVWMPAAVSLLIWSGMMLLARYPHVFNYPWKVTPTNASDLYRLSRSMLYWMNAECMLIFAVILWTMIRTAHGDSAGMTPWFLPVAMLAIFGTMGYFMFASSKAVKRDAPGSS